MKQDRHNVILRLSLPLFSVACAYSIGKMLFQWMTCCGQSFSCDLSKNEQFRIELKTSFASIFVWHWEKWSNRNIQLNFNDVCFSSPSFVPLYVISTEFLQSHIFQFGFLSFIQFLNWKFLWIESSNRKYDERGKWSHFKLRTKWLNAFNIMLSFVNCWNRSVASLFSRQKLIET